MVLRWKAVAKTLILSCTCLLFTPTDGFGQLTTGQGRIVINPLCLGGAAPNANGNTPEEDICLEECMREDAEAWRAYEYYCQEIEVELYDRDSCYVAAFLVPVDQCISECCNQNPGPIDGGNLADLDEDPAEDYNPIDEEESIVSDEPVDEESPV